VPGPACRSSARARLLTGLWPPHVRAFPLPCAARNRITVAGAKLSPGKSGTALRTGSVSKAIRDGAAPSPVYPTSESTGNPLESEGFVVLNRDWGKLRAAVVDRLVPQRLGLGLGAGASSGRAGYDRDFASEDCAAVDRESLVGAARTAVGRAFSPLGSSAPAPRVNFPP
jgi:hypothetical protein